MGFRCFGGRSSSRLRNGYVENAFWGGVGRGEVGGEVGWGECRDGHASAHRPHWAAQAPAHHVPRTSGRERMEMCANGHRLWPAVATAAAASSACWQHALSAGGTARGQEAGLAGGGVAARLGEVTRAGQTAPESRDADAAAPTRPPALAALAAAARWQPGPAAAAPEGPGPGAQWPLAPPGGALRLDRRPTGRGPPAVGACGTSGQPLLPPAHHPILALGCGSTIEPYERWSKHRGFVAVFGRVFGYWLKY